MMRDQVKWIVELIVKTLLDTWIRPLIVAIALAVVEMARRTFPWLNAYQWAWGAISILLATASLFLFRRKPSNHQIPYFGLFGSASSRRRRDVFEEPLPSGGALWRITVPAYKSAKDCLESDEIEAHTPPYCKHCGTELEEEQGLFQRHTWHCVGCGTTMRGKRSFRTEAQRAVKIARRRIRDQKEP